MNFKTFLAIVCVLLIAGIASAAYATYVHSAIKIGDGKDIDLAGQIIGNGFMKDVVCVSGCTALTNETNATNITTGTLSNLRLPANITNKTNISAKQIGGVIYADQYPTIQDAINATTPTNCEVKIPSGTYNISSYIIKDNIYKILQMGNTGSCINGLKLSGAGMNTTVLRYAGSLPPAGSNGLYFIRSYYEAVDVFDTDGSQIDISISDMTLDLNGLVPYGITIAYTKGFLIENVRIMNQNRVDAGGYTWAVGVYGNKAIIRNIYVDKSKETANTNYTGIAEYLATGILFNSVNSYDNIAENIFINGSGSGVLKSGVAFEDNPQRISLKNIYIEGVNGSAVSLATSSTTVREISITNLHVRNTHKIIHIPARMVDSIFSDVWGSNISLPADSSAITISGNNNTIQNVYIDNIEQPLKRGYLGLDIAENGAVSGSGFGNKLYNINIKNINITYGGIGVTDGAANNTIYGGSVINTTSYGLWAQTFRGGVVPSRNIMSGITVFGNTPSQIYNPNNNIMIENYGASPYNFGNNASAPTAFGAGDTYFNTTKNRPCFRNNTAWVSYYTNLSDC